MRSTLKTFGIMLGSAVAMVAALEVARHLEARIASGTDAALESGLRLWQRCADDLRQESEVRKALPWVYWLAWEAQEDQQLQHQAREILQHDRD